MTETKNSIRGFMRRLRPAGAALALALVLGAVAGPSAQAQNLVADPYFTNGVPGNGSSDALGNGYFTYNATAATMDGVTGVDLGGGGGYFQIDPIAGFNPNGVNYVFTFLAAAVNPDIYTSVNGVFAPVSNGSCVECSDTVITETLTSTGLTQYSVTATSTTAYGDFSYLYVQNNGTGDVFVTGLDFQPAPSPVAGGGILSFCLGTAVLALHRRRRKAS